MLVFCFDMITTSTLQVANKDQILLIERKNQEKRQILHASTGPNTAIVIKGLTSLELMEIDFKIRMFSEAMTEISYPSTNISNDFL